MNFGIANTAPAEFVIGIVKVPALTSLTTYTAFFDYSSSSSTNTILGFIDKKKQVSTNQVPVTDQWYHFTFVYTGNQAYIYVNGQLNSVKSTNSKAFPYSQKQEYNENYLGRAISNPILSLITGGRTYPGVNADMDEISIFNVPLTSDQVNYHHIKNSFLTQVNNS